MKIISVKGFEFHFTPNRWMVLLTLMVLFIFCKLGAWQLHRAKEKRTIVAHVAHYAAKAPRAWQPPDNLPNPYEKIRVSGHFTTDLFFLDNQHHHHQLGYHVISPLVLTNQHVIMVDRGWVKAMPSREIMPSISTPTQTIFLSGEAYYPSKNQWVLGQSIEKKQAHTTIVELINVKLFSIFLHKDVYPFIIRLDNQSAHGFRREWTSINMPPQRHEGYAFQWFMMAFTVLILFITLNTNIKKANE